MTSQLSRYYHDNSLDTQTLATKMPTKEERLELEKSLNDQVPESVNWDVTQVSEFIHDIGYPQYQVWYISYPAQFATNLDHVDGRPQASWMRNVEIWSMPWGVHRLHGCVRWSPTWA